MIHVATGNALDVVYDYVDGVQVLKGLQRHGDDGIIPLPEADGLVEVLRVVIAECRDSYRRAGAVAGGLNELSV